MKNIRTHELVAMLESRTPLAIIDIRDEAAFADWRIPGATNLPVIEAMRANNPEPLCDRTDDLPKDRPLVMVCNEGVSSAKATAILEPLGFDVSNLAGGMRKWSMAHTEAPIVFSSNPDAFAIQVRRNGKGCLTYIIGSEGVATVVDPAVDERVYIDIAQRHGLNITRVIETHVHADHISRARALAQTTGAELALPANDRVTFDHHQINDGDRFSIGALDVRAIASPGHTGESMCYQISDEVLLCGDTLFVDSVGRPDLEKGDEGAIAGAEMLYRSLHERLLLLDDDLRIFPAHAGTAIGFDGAPVSARLGDLRSELDLLSDDQTSFVSKVVDGIGPKPPSFNTVIAINEGKMDLGSTDPTVFEAGPNRCAVS